MEILEVRPEQVICYEDNVIFTRPNTPFYSVKYNLYNSGRIAYTFSDVDYVMETFDERIFNCWHDGKRIQLRQDFSDKLADIISKPNADQLANYVDLFKSAYQEIPQLDVIYTYLRNIEGVERSDDGFIVYDDFKIDWKGNAWVAGKNSAYNQDGREWYSLCIVMKNSSHSYQAKEGVLPDSEGNLLAVNSLTMTIISKVVFLLNPNLQDDVFTGQLSKTLLGKLRQIKGGE